MGVSQGHGRVGVKGRWGLTGRQPTDRAGLCRWYRSGRV